MVEAVVIPAHSTLHSNNISPETFWWFFPFLCSLILDVSSSSLVGDFGKNMKNIYKTHHVCTLCILLPFGVSFSFFFKRTKFDNPYYIQSSMLRLT